MSELSTIIYQVNFKYIIDNCLDKNMWRKKWKIFEYDNTSLELCLYSINLSDNTLSLTVCGSGSGYRTSSFSLPLSEEHFNEEVFYQKLFSAIRFVLELSELYLIKGTEIYEEAVQKDDDYEDLLKTKAEKRLDDLGIDDEEVRYIYIKEYVNERESNFASGLINKMRYHYSTHLYYMLCYQFEKLAKNYSQNLLKILSLVSIEGRDQMINNVKLAFDKIDLCDMVDDDVNRIDDVLLLRVDDE